MALQGCGAGGPAKGRAPVAKDVTPVEIGQRAAAADVAADDGDAQLMCRKWDRARFI